MLVTRITIIYTHSIKKIIFTDVLYLTQAKYTVRNRSIRYTKRFPVLVAFYTNQIYNFYHSKSVNHANMYIDL